MISTHVGYDPQAHEAGPESGPGPAVPSSSGFAAWSFRKFPENNGGHQLLFGDKALRRQMGQERA